MLNKPGFPSPNKNWTIKWDVKMKQFKAMKGAAKNSSASGFNAELPSNCFLYELKEGSTLEHIQKRKHPNRQPQIRTQTTGVNRLPSSVVF